MFDSSSLQFLRTNGLIYAMCVCLRIVAPNAYCVVVFFILRLVYPTLPVSLDCPLVVVPSVFSKVYWTHPFLRRVLPEMFTFLRSKYL
jgi:hypothetical protein